VVASQVCVCVGGRGGEGGEGEQRAGGEFPGRAACGHVLHQNGVRSVAAVLDCTLEYRHMATKMCP
jgi:hypothetical protein